MYIPIGPDDMQGSGGNDSGGNGGCYDWFKVLVIIVIAAMIIGIALAAQPPGGM